MKKFPSSVRGVCLSLALFVCVCASLSGALFGGVSEAASMPAVTVTASDARAAEAGPDPGAFTFRRSVLTSKPLTVYYTVGGTAAAGADYAALSGSATIPAGRASVVVKVSPFDDAGFEGPETVNVTLTRAVSYNLGSPAGAEVTIDDNDTAPTPTPTPAPRPAPQPSSTSRPAGATRTTARRPRRRCAASRRPPRAPCPTRPSSSRAAHTSSRS